MEIISAIFFGLVITGLSALILWNIYKIIKTLVSRKKSKKEDDLNKVDRKDK